MKAAPAWLSYAAPAIALLALLISLATYQRAGPRIRAHLELLKSRTDDDLLFVLKVRNSGLAPVDLLGFYFSLNYYLDVRFFQLEDSDLEGEKLPYRIESSSGKQWIINPIKMVNRLKTPGKLPWVALKFRLPNLLHLNLFPPVWRIVGISIDLGNGISVHAGPDLWSAIILYSALVKSDRKEEQANGSPE